MNDDQGLVAMMSVFLILMTVWLVYKKEISAILFTPTATQQAASSGGGLPGFLQPFIDPTFIP